MNILLRKLALIAATAFAIASPIIQSATGWGLSAADFSRQGDSTLRAAGYAFSIWSLIYLGLIALTVYQALPRNDGSKLLRRIWFPTALAIAGCGAWIWASAANQRWLSVLIILISATAAISVLVVSARAATGRGARADRWLVVWPMAGLAGWLTVASALNILMVMTAEGVVATRYAVPAALAGIVAAGAVALAVLRASRTAIYGLPVAWGLVAVFVAERGPQMQNAWTALAAAGVVLFYAGAAARR